MVSGNEKFGNDQRILGPSDGVPKCSRDRKRNFYPVLVILARVNIKHPLFSSRFVKPFEVGTVSGYGSSLQEVSCIVWLPRVTIPPVTSCILSREA